MAKSKYARIPQEVQRRILRRGARGDQAVVLTLKNGLPSRVFGVEEYLQRQQLPRRVQPWKYRRQATTPDPLGAADGTVLGSLSRSEIAE